MPSTGEHVQERLENLEESVRSSLLLAKVGLDCDEYFTCLVNELLQLLDIMLLRGGVAIRM